MSYVFINETTENEMRSHIIYILISVIIQFQHSGNRTDSNASSQYLYFRYLTDSSVSSQFLCLCEKIYYSHFFPVESIYRISLIIRCSFVIFRLETEFERIATYIYNGCCRG